MKPALLAVSLFAAALPLVAEAQTSVGQFYRQSDRPEVMFQYDNDYHCHVQNPSQMEAWGGFGLVNTLPRVQMRGEFTGPCPFPDGFYRLSNDARVYRLYGGGMFNVGEFSCYVTDPAQMARYGGFGQVRVIEPSSDISIARPRPGPCADP